MQIDGNFGLLGTNYCSIKDKDGMIWFSTSGGIARYDSENLEIYGENQGLNVSNIFSMFFDSKGKLWMVGLNSLWVVDLKAKLLYELTSVFNFDNAYNLMESKDGKFGLPIMG